MLVTTALYTSMFDKHLTVINKFFINIYVLIFNFSSEVNSCNNEIVADLFWVKTVNTKILTKTHKYDFTIWGQISICSHKTANNLLWSTHNMLVVCLRSKFWCLKIPNNCVFVFYYIRAIILVKWKITDRPTDKLKSKVQTFFAYNGRAKYYRFESDGISNSYFYRYRLPLNL